MPAFLADLGAALAAPVLKWGVALMLLLAAGGGGFVWGETHATAITARAALQDADARVTAAQKSDSVLLADYLTRLSAATARGNTLSAALSKDQAQLATVTRAAQETISHVLAPNPVCDLPATALAVLRAQPARH